MIVMRKRVVTTILIFLAVLVSARLLNSQQTSVSDETKAPPKIVKGILSGATVKPAPLNDGTYVAEVRAFASEMSPDGWIECDGRSLIAANHVALVNVIGTRFGVDDAGKFRIPDLRGTFARGWNHSTAVNDGKPFTPDANVRTVPGGGPAYTDNNDHVGTFELDQMRSHNHP